MKKVEYFHVELETHDVIIAEGALAESFIDDDSRGMFSNANEYRQFDGDVATELAQFCAPRREEGYRVEAVRRRIALRAGVRADQPRLEDCADLLTASAPTPSRAGRRTRSTPRRRSASTSTSAAALSVKFSLTGIARISLGRGLGAVTMVSFSHRRKD